MRLVLGILVAAGASTFYSLGIALQAMDAKAAPHEEHLRLALAWGLVRSKRWLLGTGLSILGFPLQVVALLLAPLAVVQPALAAGLLVLMVVGEHMLGERPGRYEYAAVLAIVIGVIGAGLCAPRSTSHVTDVDTTTLVLVILSAAALTPYVLRVFGTPRSEITMFCAGCAFAFSGVATKLAADDLHGGSILLALLWTASTAVAGGVGTLSEMSALQSRPAIQVAPVVFVTQTAIPVALAPVLFGEYFDTTPLNGVPLILSLLLLVVGAGALARSPLLLALMDPQPVVSEDSDSVPSPSADSAATIRSSPSTELADPSSSTTKTSPARIGR
jgi:drug/metabolite transporter (DMT)-like permease